MFIFLAMIPVLLGALLSMPSLFIYQFVKKHLLVKVLLIVAGLVAVVLLGVWIVSSIPSEINFLKSGIPVKQINAFTDAIANGFPPVLWLNKLIIGTPYSKIIVENI